LKEDLGKNKKGDKNHKFKINFNVIILNSFI